jgi:hypothetical protein
LNQVDHDKQYSDRAPDSALLLSIYIINGAMSLGGHESKPLNGMEEYENADVRYQPSLCD